MAIAKFVSPFYESLITILSDYALNSLELETFIGSHSGWRFLTTLQSGIWKAKSVTDYGKSLLNKERTAFDRKIRGLRDSAEVWNALGQKGKWSLGSSVARVINDIASRASIISEVRSKGNEIFAIPEVYLEKSVQDLPFPPTTAVPEEQVLLPISINYDEANHDDWVNWIFLMNFIACVVNKNAVTCPIKRKQLFCASANEFCDKITTDIAKELNHNCAFYKFLKSFGIEIHIKAD